MIDASAQDDHVRAQGFGAGATLTFTIRESPGPGGTVLFSGSRTADPGGHYFLSQFEHGVNLVAGNEVEVSDLSTTRILTIENLALAAVDRSAGTVSGTADPNEPAINVSVFKPTCGTNDTVAADGDGNWLADFSADPCAVDVQANVQASIADGDGDATTAGLGPMNVSAGLTHDQIFLNGFNPGTNVSVTISDGSGPVFGPQNFTPNAQGNAFIDRSVHNVDIVPGLTIEASQGSTTKTLTTANLAITSIDAGNDDVTGISPASAQVNVNVNTPGGGFAFQSVAADGGGNWTADFSNVPNQHDITSGTSANASLNDADGDGTFVDKQPPQVHASLTFDGINLNGWDPGSDVSLTISDGGGTLFGPQDFTPDGQGNVFVDPSDHNVDIVPGLTITATQGATTKTLITANLAITDVNAGDDDVSGTAPPGAQVNVNVNDPGPCCGSFQQVTADGSGDWTADFSSGPNQFDITGTTNAHAQVNDADNDATFVDKQPAQINGNLAFDNIDGQGFAPDSSVTIEVRSAPGVDPPIFADNNVPTDGGGNFFAEVWESGVDLVPGNEVTVSDGAETKVLELVHLEISSVDEDNDDVIGTAPASALVEVNVNDQDGGASQQVTADGSGNWTADFSNPPNQYDITSGTGADAAVQDADGDRTRYGKEPPFIGVEPQQNDIFGDGWAPNSSVTVEVRSAPGVEPPIFSTTSATDQTGFFNVNTDGAPDVIPGQEVTVTDGVNSKVHEVIDVTITAIDPADDDVTGTAPAGTPLFVQVDEAAGRHTEADGSGNWTADFSGEYDILDDSWARANANDGDGDSTAVEKRPATFGAELDVDSMHGQGFVPDASVSVEIRSAQGVNPPLFSGNVPTDGNGEFGMGPFDHNIDLVPGMAITVSDGPSTKLLVLSELTVDPIDPATDVVSGTATPGAQVDLFVQGRNGEAEASPTAGSPQGHWSHDFTSEINIIGGDAVSPTIQDADGDYTGLDERHAAAVEASLSDDVVCPNGFGSNVTVTIRDSGGTRLWRGGIPSGPAGCVPFDVHGVNLVPGMIVEATDGTINKDVTLVGLEITSVDSDADTVEGRAPAGALVILSINGPFEVVGEAFADGTGAWTADLSDPEFGVDDQIFASVPDTEGDETQSARQSPAIQGHLTLEKVTGCGFALESFVTVTINGSPTPLVPTDGSGCFTLENAPLQAGDTIVVTDGAITRDLTLAPLTMDVDIPSGVITGTAPAGAEVFVGFGVVDQEKGDGTVVTADGSGNWTADFGEDLGEGVEIEASVADEGDRTIVSWLADVRFGAADYTVPEAAGSVEITVERSGAAHVTVGVSHATADGTATAGQDYDETSDALSFADGVGSQTYTIPITDDTDDENDETFEVALSDPTGGAEIDSPAMATITIEDDDGGPAILDLSSATYSGGEKGGRVTITVQRTGNLSNSGAVSFQVPDAGSPGNASPNVDYTPTSGTLSFGPGDISKTFDVTVKDDNVFEGDESVGVKILNPTGGAALGTQETATLTIVEDDPQPAFRFAQPSYTTVENVGQMGVIVQRVGAQGNSGTVNYAVVGGSATQGADYSILGSGQISFGNNTASRVITIAINNDNQGEPPENIVIALTGASPPFTIGSPSQTTVTIAASDQRPDVQISTNPFSGFVGDNQYDPPTTQQVATSMPRFGSTDVYFRVQNDGQVPNTLFVGRPGGGRSSIQYFDYASNSNITSVVDAGSYQVTLAPGQYTLIRARQFAGRARSGTYFEIPLMATWTGDALLRDAATATGFVN